MMSTAKFVYLLIIILSTFNLSNSFKTFGDPCDGDCDERKGLVCSPESKVCGCMLPNATIYDEEHDVCVTKAGHPSRTIGNQIRCVKNAQSPALHLPCTCDKGFFQDKRNGTCLPVAAYGEACTTKKPCDKISGIECVGNKNKHFQCKCKYGPNDAFYDPEEQVCISYPSANCSFSLRCVKNANCSKDILEVKEGKNLNGKSYYFNATVGRKCACLPGFRETKNRECLATYRSPCDDITTFCNPEENLSCFDKKICLCKNPLSQIYDHQKHKCQNLINANCDGSGQGDCIENSKCLRGVCTCNSGFTQGKVMCFKDFGENCEKDECNFHRGLSCSNNNTCSCFDGFLVYDQTKRSCFALEGSRCGEFSLTSGEEADGLDFKSETAEACSRNLINYKTAIINCRDDLKCENIMGNKQCVK